MPSLNCFVIMPFREEFDAVFKWVRDAVERAVPGLPITCHWLKDMHAAGRITDDIVQSLREAAVCVADVTDSNPNVMWETGYAMALGKPTILIAQRVEELPFDLKVHRVLPYGHDMLGEATGRLGQAMRETLARYDIQTALPQAPENPLQHIAVTGTMLADPARARRRIATLLQPYLDPQVVWYCGSNGLVDEECLRFLVAKQQRAYAVGYHRYDFSDQVFQMVEGRKVGFLDASVEPVPKGLRGGTSRDVFFCAKADLVILIWDGASVGTGQLMHYFQDNAKNLLIGFI